MKLNFKFFLLIGWALFLSIEMNAQFEPQFSQTAFNKLLINPAAAGSEDGISFNLLHRSQYVKIGNSPIASEHFGVSAPIASISSGLGLNVTNDFIGYFRNTYIAALYDYRKKFGFGTLSVGVNVGFAQSSLDGSKLTTPDGVYTSGVNHIDGVIPATKQQAIAPDFGAGIYLSGKKYFVGIAASHLYSKSKYKTCSIQLAPSFSFTGGYNLDINKNLKIQPTALIKTDLKKFQLDLNIFFTIYNNILTGIALRGYEGRSLDAVVLYGGFQIKQFRLLYSYDVNTSYLHSFNAGSHEISVGYLIPILNKERKGYFYHNARFL